MSQVQTSTGYCQWTVLLPDLFTIYDADIKSISFLYCTLVTHTVILISTSLKCPDGKGSSYIAQYPVLRTAQSALHFTSLTDLFTQIPSRLLWEASSHMLQLMREGCSYTYPPLSIVRYSFKQLSELEQCRVKKLAQVFNAAARIRTRVLVVESPKLYP